MNAGTSCMNSAIGPVIEMPTASIADDVVGVGIDERDLVAGAGEVRAEGSADRARAPDEESHCATSAFSPRRPTNR